MSEKALTSDQGLAHPIWNMTIFVCFFTFPMSCYRRLFLHASEASVIIATLYLDSLREKKEGQTFHKLGCKDISCLCIHITSAGNSALLRDPPVVGTALSIPTGCSRPLAGDDRKERTIIRTSSLFLCCQPVSHPPSVYRGGVTPGTP